MAQLPVPQQGARRGYIAHLCWNVEYTVIVFIISDTVFTCDTADDGDDTTKLYIHSRLVAGRKQEAARRHVAASGG